MEICAQISKHCTLLALKNKIQKFQPRVLCTNPFRNLTLPIIDYNEPQMIIYLFSNSEGRTNSSVYSTGVLNWGKILNWVHLSEYEFVFKKGFIRWTVDIFEFLVWENLYLRTQICLSLWHSLFLMSFLLFFPFFLFFSFLLLTTVTNNQPNNDAKIKWPPKNCW